MKTEPLCSTTGNRAKNPLCSPRRALPMLKVEPMKTQVDDSSSELRQKLVFQLKRNMKLGGEVTDEMMDFLNPLEDDVAFVNLAAFALCKHTLRKQAMLEVSSLGKRANMLLDDLLRENERLDLLRKSNRRRPFRRL